MAIRAFRGAHAFLSNFAPSPVTWGEVTYPTVEHAYQAAKTEAPAWIARIAAAGTPAEARRLGRQAPLRADWAQVRRAVMGTLLRKKFAHPALRTRLLATGTALLQEGNWWGDRFWGVDERTGVGENHLGQLLMTLREELRDPPPSAASPGGGHRT